MALTPIQTGNPITWGWFTSARGNAAGFPMMATFIEKDFDIANGVIAGPTRQTLQKGKVNNEIIEAGPLPLGCYWWPKGKEGVQVPDSFPANPLNKVVTADDLIGLPHTFFRRTSFIQEFQTSYHLGTPVPYNDLSDQKDIHGGDEDMFDLNSYGWWQIAYEGYPNGTEHSCWLAWIDGQPVTFGIEHRNLLENGDEASSLTSYWKPKDIWDNVIYPRIKLGRPIKRFAVAGQTGDPPEYVFAENGPVLNSAYIQGASYLFPVESFFLGAYTALSSWTADHAVAGVPTSYIGLGFQAYPGWILGNIAWLAQYCINANINPIDAFSGLIPQATTNCLWPFLNIWPAILDIQPA